MICCVWKTRNITLNLRYPKHCFKISKKSILDDYHGYSRGLVEMRSHGCECEDIGPDPYEYVPSNCTLRPWDAEEFCTALGGRKILLIGDSLMRQIATILMNRIALDFWGREGGCQGQLTMAISDRLLGRIPRDNRRNRGKPWTDYVREHRPDLVVLTAGPHVRPLEFDRILDRVVAQHAAEHPDLPLVWRSQVGAGCAWPAPLEAPPDRAFWRNYSRSRRVYNYAHFEAYDRAAAARFPGPNRAYMDLSPLKLRMDRRVGSSPGSPYPGDCTHFCHPGPMDDLVPRLFLQLVREWPFRAAGAGSADVGNASASGQKL